MTGWARPSPTSTPPPSRRPTGSACRSSTASGRRGMSTARSPWSRTSATSWRRWSTTSTSASSPTRPNPLDFTASEAMEIAKSVLDHPDADIVPPLSHAAGPAVHPPPLRRGGARGDGATASRRCKILTYDDVLIRLRRTLLDEERGPAACARLRERYDVVLVDEFQDTDPVQWDIMHRAFGAGRGDAGADRRPQAGDLRLPRAPTCTPTCRRQRGGAVRVDPRRQLAQRPGAARGLRRALRRRPARLRRHRLPARSGPPTPTRSRASSARPAGAPLRVRMRARRRRPGPADGQEGCSPRRPTPGPSSPGTSRPTWCSCSSARPSSSPGAVTAPRSSARRCTPATSPCWSGPTATPTIVRDALHAAGVPAVIGGSGSVFATEPAQEWLRLLEALERPTARDRASLAALTRFVGWTRRGGGHGGRGRVGGPALVAAPLGGAAARPGRRLAVRDGEQLARRARAGARAPVGRALHDRPAPHRPAPPRGRRVRGPRARPPWPPGCGRRIHDADAGRRQRGAGAAPRVRRRGGAGDHHPPQQGPRVPDRLLPLHVGRLRPQHDATCRCSTTRPTATGAPSTSGHEGNELRPAPEAGARGGAGRGPPPALRRPDPGPPPGRAVVGRRPGQPALAPGPPALRPRRRRASCRPTAPRRAATTTVESRPLAALGPRVAVERVGPPSAGALASRRRETPPHARGGASSTARSTPTGAGRRTRASPRPARPARRRERARAARSPRTRRCPWRRRSRDEAAPTRRPTARRRRCGLADMPGGALVGTVMHGVLRAHSTSTRPTWRRRSARRSTREMAWRNVDLGDTDAVVAGLCAAIESPLGPLVGRHRAPRHRPAGPARRAELRDPAGRWRRADGQLHVGARGRPARSAPAARTIRWPATPTALRDPALDGVLRGYLTGSLDLVFRLPGDRFVLADYKTNRLGAAERDAHGLALPARGPAGRDGGRPLPAAGPALLGGAAPLPALAPARLRARRATSAASSTCSCAA